MTCDQARQAFTELYDETLAGSRLVTITQHLATCQDCRAEWATFRKTIQVVADLGGAEPSPGFAARVRQQIEAPTRLQRALRWLFLPLRVKVPVQAVALCLIAFAGLLLYQRTPEMQREVELRPATLPPPVAREAPGMPPEASVPPGRQAPVEQRPQDKVSEVVPAPPPHAALEGERDRTDTALRDEAKPAEKPVTAEPPKAEESGREFGARTVEPGQAVVQVQPRPPAPGDSGGPTGDVQPAPKSLAAPPAALKPSAGPPPIAEPQPYALKAKPADEVYSTALTESARQRHDRAIEEFRAFIGQHPGDARVPDARLRLADAYVAQRRYAEAVQEYEGLARDFPWSPLLPAALLKLGQLRLSLGDRSGCQVLRDLLTRFPQAAEATPARETLSARCP